MYSTDMGNVLHLVPATHPFLDIGRMVFPHSAKFAAQSDTDEASRAMLDGGVALAWTAVDARLGVRAAELAIAGCSGVIPVRRDGEVARRADQALPAGPHVVRALQAVSLSIEGEEFVSVVGRSEAARARCWTWSGCS